MIQCPHNLPGIIPWKNIKKSISTPPSWTNNFHSRFQRGFQYDSSHFTSTGQINRWNSTNAMPIKYNISRFIIIICLQCIKCSIDIRINILLGRRPSAKTISRIIVAKNIAAGLRSKFTKKTCSTFQDPKNCCANIKWYK